MKRITLVPLLLLLVPAALRGAEPPLAARPAMAERLALYRLWVADQMAYLHQPGVAVGIVHDRELVWAEGFGFADLAARRPVTPDTVFRLGSISKIFTATAVLLLRDAGRLGLDDPVKRYLPWLAVRNPFPHGPEITVRHLLTHTSGLPREAPLPYWTDREFPDRERLIEVLAGLEVAFEAGTAYQYSNLGIALAGEVVAAASGEPFADYVERHILAPTGMTSTFVEAPALPPERLATGYLIVPPGGEPPLAPDTDARALTPAASLSSTVRDLARFVAAHLPRQPGEAGLLPAATQREMQRVHWLDADWKGGRGLGFGVWRQGERTLVGHAGWVAGHRSQIAFDPAARLGVIVLTNSDEGGPGAYVRQAFELVVPAIEKALAPAPEVVPVADPERYAGAYHSPWGEVTDVLVIDGRLVLYDHGHPPAADPEASLTRLLPDGEHAFRVERDAGPPGERVAFELLSDGRVARVKVGENYLFPAGCGTIGPDLQCTWE